VGDLVRSLTSIGRTVALVVPVSFALAALSGWKEFSVIGLGAFLALLVGVVSVIRPLTIIVSRTLVPAQVTAGESSTVVVALRNPTTRRMVGLEADDLAEGRALRLGIPSLLAGEIVEEHYVLSAPRRGVIEVGPVKLGRSDPLSLFARSRGQGPIDRLWVRPRVHSMVSVSAGWAHDVDGPTTDSSPGGSGAFHTLREYQSGDDLRHVHWRTSARRGSLMVRHFVETRHTQEVVLLDPRTHLYSDESFETAVEVAASICASAERAGRVATLALPLQPAPSHDTKLHYLDRLVLVDRTNTLSVSALMVSVPRAVDSASALVIVTGDTEPQELLDAARRALRSGLIVVVRVVAGAEPSVTGRPGSRVVTTPSASRLTAAWSEAVTR
jgi:uncharacterized protein (DUF58 family)